MVLFKTLDFRKKFSFSTVQWPADQKNLQKQKEIFKIIQNSFVKIIF